jgi:hypothetical protein
MIIRKTTGSALLFSLALALSSLSTSLQSAEGVVWDLTGVYADTNAWESALEAAQAEIAELPELAGSLGDSASVLRFFCPPPSTAFPRSRRK